MTISIEWDGNPVRQQFGNCNTVADGVATLPNGKRYRINATATRGCRKPEIALRHLPSGRAVPDSHLATVRAAALEAWAAILEPMRAAYVADAQARDAAFMAEQSVTATLEAFTDDEFSKYAAIREDEGQRDLAARFRRERRMAVATIAAALARGYSISVFDCEETTVFQSTDAIAILSAMFTTDDDRLTLYRADGSRVGWFWFVYGNDGWDVISDYSVSPETTEIYETVLGPLSDAIEAGR